VGPFYQQLVAGQLETQFNTAVFDFALAKVHYIGLIGAQQVRVFFRLYTTIPFFAAPRVVVSR
jgi:hypothetical protein